MIDVHTHILPNIDDGSPNFNMSIDLLRAELENGISDVFLTPHSYYLNCNPTKKFNDFKQKCKDLNIPVNLYLGCEISFDVDNVKLMIEKIGKDFPTMNGTRYILVEFVPYDISSYNTFYIVNKIIENGYFPIIAHIERYKKLTKNDVEKLKEAGCYIQTNFDSNYSDVKPDLYGSDCHTTYWRPVTFSKGNENKKLVNELIKGNEDLWKLEFRYPQSENKICKFFPSETDAKNFWYKNVYEIVDVNLERV